MACLLAGTSFQGHTLPSSGNVTAGAATITQNTPTSIEIQQGSNRAVIDWQSFDIGANELATFLQPGADSITLNRIANGLPTEILGQLKANGQIFIMNNNGVILGNNAQVDVGSLLATSSNLNNADFMNGAPLLSFTAGNNPNAQVINNGNITVADGGLIALVAPSVTNNGVLTARLGKVSLAAGEAFTLDLYGDQLVKLAVDGDLTESKVTQNGTINATAGVVALTASQAADALNNIVNMEGHIHANSLSTQNGRIILGTTEGYARVNGTLSAQGIEDSTAGGIIKVTGKQVLLSNNANLSTSGHSGGGTINVGGNYQGKGPLPNAEQTAVLPNAQLESNATHTGDGGRIIVWADQATQYYGTATAEGGVQSGNGGFIEVSGKEGLVFQGDASTRAANGEIGTLLLDPRDIFIVNGAGPRPDDPEIADGAIFNGDGGALTDFTISEQALEALTAGSNIALYANNDIIMSNLGDDELNLKSIGDVRFIADADLDGSGVFDMAFDDFITTGGAPLTIIGQTVSVGGVDTTSAANGHVNLNAAGGAGIINLGNEILTSQGEITINGSAVFLQDHTRLDSGAAPNGNNITVNGAISGDYSLDVDSANVGTITLNGFNVDTFTASGGGNLILGSGSYITDTNLDFGAVTTIDILGDTIFTANDGGSPQTITFNPASQLDGAFNVQINGSTANLGNIGQTTPLASLDVNANTTNIYSPISTTGAQDYSLDVNTSANLITTNATISVGDSLLVNNNTIINTGSGAGDINIGNTVNGTNDLTLIAGTGDINVGGQIGGVTPLQSLTVTANDLTFTNGVITSGAQTYNGPIDIGGTFTTLNSTVNFNNPVTLIGNTLIDTSGGTGDVVFNDTLDGTFNLTMLTGSGNVTFGGVVGGLLPINSILGNGNAVALNTINTVGGQSYSGALSLDGDLNTTSGPLTLTGNVNLLGDTILTSGGTALDDITITGAMIGDYQLELVAGLGDIVLNGLNIDEIVFTSGDEARLSGTIDTDKPLDFTPLNGIILTGDTVITADDAGTLADIVTDAGNIITGGGNNLTISGDTVTLYDVSGVNTLDITANSALVANSPIVTTGDQDYSGPTSLGGSITSSGGNIQFANTLNLLNNLNINTSGGDLTFQNTVNGGYDMVVNLGAGDFAALTDIGSITPLTSLDITANSILLQAVTTINAQNYVGVTDVNGLLSAGTAINTSGDLTLQGGLSTSTGSIDVGGNLILTNDAILQTGGLLGDDLNVAGNVLGDYALSVNTGAADINLSGDVDIDQWTFVAGDNLRLGGSTYEADNDINFGAVRNIILTNDTQIRAIDGTTRADIITNGPNNTITGPYNLTLVGDNVTLQQIGELGPNKLLSLNVDANNITLEGSIYTVGGQNYTSVDSVANDLATDGADINFLSNLNMTGDALISTGAGGGNIYFGGTLNGPHNLNLQAGTGNITLDAPFGAVIPLNTVAMGGANITLNDITSLGAQTYTGAITLGGNLINSGENLLLNGTVALQNNTQLSTGTLGGNITVTDALSGPYDINLEAGTGAISLQQFGTAGARLGDVIVTSANGLTFNNGAYVESFSQLSGTGSTLFGNSPGLNTLEHVIITGSDYINGTITAASAELTPNEYMDIILDVGALRIGGGGGSVEGRVAGEAGRNAARKINFTVAQGGPYYFNGFSLPLLGDTTAAQTLQNTRLEDNYAIPATLNYTGTTMEGLNPFSPAYQLLTASGIGWGSTPYFNQNLYDYTDTSTAWDSPLLTRRSAYDNVTLPTEFAEELDL